MTSNRYINAQPKQPCSPAKSVFEKGPYREPTKFIRAHESLLPRIQKCLRRAVLTLPIRLGWISEGCAIALP